MRSPSRLRRLVLVAPALRLGPAGEAPACTPLPGWVTPAARPSRRALGPDRRHRELPGIHRRPARPLRPPPGGDHARAGCRLPVADASVLLRRRHRRLGVRVRRRGLRTVDQPRSAPDLGLVAQWPAGGPDLGHGGYHHADRPGAVADALDAGGDSSWSCPTSATFRTSRIRRSSRPRCSARSAPPSRPFEPPARPPSPRNAKSVDHDPAPLSRPVDPRPAACRLRRGRRPDRAGRSGRSR